MSDIFDALAKDVLDIVLSEAGTVDPETAIAEVAAQRGDVLFVPDPARDGVRATLGLLGRMAAAPCIFEAFSSAPPTEKAAASLRKLLNHRHTRSLAGKVAGECAWLVCAGRPDGALDAFGALPMDGWPRGFYASPAEVRLRFVVVRELPGGDDTRALRLMGRGPVLHGAFAELAARRAEDPRDARLLAAAARRLPRMFHGTENPPEVEMINVEELMSEFEAYEERVRAEGRVEGRTEGIHAARQELAPALAVLAELRLGRPLTSDELSALVRRVDEGGADAANALATMGLDALGEWLRAPKT